MMVWARMAVLGGAAPFELPDDGGSHSRPWARRMRLHCCSRLRTAPYVACGSLFADVFIACPDADATLPEARLKCAAPGSSAGAHAARADSEVAAWCARMPARIMDALDRGFTAISPSAASVSTQGRRFDRWVVVSCRGRTQGNARGESGWRWLAEVGRCVQLRLGPEECQSLRSQAPLSQTQHAASPGPRPGAPA